MAMCASRGKQRKVEQRGRSRGGGSAARAGGRARRDRTRQNKTRRDKNGQCAVLVARRTMFGGSAVGCRLLSFE